MKPGPRIENPFEGIACLLASDYDSVEFRVELDGAPVYAVLRPMDAAADERYHHLLIRQSLDPDELCPVAPGELNLLLLDATLADFQFAFRRRLDDGSVQAEQTPRGVDLDPEARRDLFDSLTPDFRRALLRACCAVNGLDPALAGLASFSDDSEFDDTAGTG